MKIFSWLLNKRPSIASSSGWISFQVGLLFLASSPLIAGLFLAFALIKATIHRPINFFRDKWNYPLLMVGVLMIIGCFEAYSGWLAWVGLANWLPFFWCFWGYQPYVLTSVARQRCGLLLLAGTIPVLITGFGQLWFGWEGPWQLFNGLIIWFIDSNGEPDGRLSGLFSYANIAGSWLALIWPFCLAFLIHSFATSRNRFHCLILTLAVVTALFMTESRNAWGGMILAIPFLLGPSNWFWLLPVLSLFIVVVAFSIFPFVPIELQFWSRKIIPEGIWSRLSDLEYMPGRPLEATRIHQWKEAINLIFKKPWFGYGAAAFSVIYPLRQGLWHGHAHNLPLELMVAHGIPVAGLMVGLTLALLICSFKAANFKAGINANLFDRAWWTASFILVFLHGADMPLFDSRINMAGWILLSGLRCLLMNPNPSKKTNSDFSYDARSRVQV